MRGVERAPILSAGLGQLRAGDVVSCRRPAPGDLRNPKGNRYFAVLRRDALNEPLLSRKCCARFPSVLRVVSGSTWSGRGLTALTGETGAAVHPIDADLAWRECRWVGLRGATRGGERRFRRGNPRGNPRAQDFKEGDGASPAPHVDESAIARVRERPDSDGDSWRLGVLADTWQHDHRCCSARPPAPVLEAFGARRRRAMWRRATRAAQGRGAASCARAVERVGRERELLAHGAQLGRSPSSRRNGRRDSGARAGPRPEMTPR